VPERFHQLRGQDIQRMGELENDRQTRHLIAALDLPDVRGRQAGSLGKILLRPRVLFADTADDLSKDCCLSRSRHTWK
jgi:hypothetical protein